jgi:hypothetical protein
MIMAIMMIHDDDNNYNKNNNKNNEVSSKERALHSVLKIFDINFLWNILIYQRR